MKIVDSKQFLLEKSKRTKEDVDFDQSVLAIIREIQKNGDVALKSFTEQFDGVSLDSFQVTKEEIEEANQIVDETFIHAVKNVKKQLIDFHEKQVETSWFMEQSEGVVLGQKVTPIEKVGVYIPGGKASYPSTVLMNVIPAKLAGVSSITMVTPPDETGKVDPQVLIAAKVAGVDQIYKIGGAQAIAALAYGTESIEKVDKIVGPGNRYVAEAKKWVYGQVGIDMIAGPSEICVIADETASPKYVAADLLSQAEHDEDATAVCITINEQLAQNIQAEVAKQLQTLDRQTIIQTSLERNGRIIIVESLSKAIDLANEIAPEHLELMIEKPTEYLPFIKHAGAIFLGEYAPEALGDYFAGPNHTLPTNGTATFSSPLGVYDFMKKSSIIHYTKSALTKAAPFITTLANAEGLSAHAKSITIRKDEEDA